ncbi:NAD(P)/FAD-dependent oxidoreductase [Gulosibacter macacae]|uniref:NAD(P)/FAD-dependent oxidoreductase n=1 Tax=Gulosibacter macacae TaxID=2488791 RepID=A0A3P3VSD0_9MICO|nr:FAD-dependent oxidoreductase [Gulosibacter macacae]RRJ85540.1 NAD(P)/FAD-dependent oxidoreductase [Gulosibacter macacae]
MTEPASLTVDVLVLGWGKGGKTFAAAMAAAGKRVAIVERSAAMYGGTCINIGCVPTKTLIHDAELRRESDDAATSFAKAVTRRDALIAKLNDVNFHMLADRDTVTVVDGQARFVSPHEVEVTPSAGGRGTNEVLRIRADLVVINTGAEPVRSEIPGADLDGVYDSTTIQHAEPFPKRLAIVGAGAIALEFASMMRGFGSQVTMLVRGDRLLPREDADVAEGVSKLLRDDGISLRFGATVTEIVRSEAALRLTLDTDTGAEHLETDALLFATGRRPATAELGLDAAGIDTDEHGAITVDEQLRTSASGVFAMGDVRGGAQQTPLSLDDHRVVLDAVTGEGLRRVSDRVAVPATTFITPPFASVGITADEAKQRGDVVRTVMVPVAGIKAMPRPKAVGDPRGFIKFVVDARTDLILGARLLHVDAQEVINLIALAMRAKVTATELRDGIWTHPSSTEALNEVLGQLGDPH